MSATPDLRFEPERERDSVGYALGVLRRRWLVVVAAVALCLFAGVVIKGIDSKDAYESSTRVLFDSSTLSDAALQPSVRPTIRSARRRRTFCSPVQRRSRPTSSGTSTSLPR